MKVIGAIIGFFCAQALGAAEPKPRQLGIETSIPGIGLGVRNYEARTEDGLWIEDFARRWYFAKLVAPCRGLIYAPRIGFVPRGSRHLDRLGAISSEGDLCEIESLVTSGPPPETQVTAKMPEAGPQTSK